MDHSRSGNVQEWLRRLNKRVSLQLRVHHLQQYGCGIDDVVFMRPERWTRSSTVDDARGEINTDRSEGQQVAQSSRNHIRESVVERGHKYEHTISTRRDHRHEHIMSTRRDESSEIQEVQK